LTQQEQRRERVREEILEAAASAIAAHGYHGMSMRDLAKATDRSLASFYNYFASKEDVLFALQSRAFENLIATSREVIRTIHSMAIQGLLGTQRLDARQDAMDALLEEQPSPIALRPIALRKGAA